MSCFHRVTMLKSLYALVLCAAALSGGCGGDHPPQTRTKEEILQEQSSLPALYLTQESRKRVTAPKSKGVFVDPATGELCWKALACERPDCPGRSADGEPFLFISPDPAMFAAPDGTIGFDPTRQGDGGPESRGQCPKCAEQRNPKSETADEAQQYRDWVVPYVLPKTAARQAELEAELQRRVRRNQHEAIANPANKPADD